MNTRQAHRNGTSTMSKLAKMDGMKNEEPQLNERRRLKRPTSSRRHDIPTELSLSDHDIDTSRLQRSRQRHRTRRYSADETSSRHGRGSNRQPSRRRSSASRKSSASSHRRSSGKKHSSRRHSRQNSSDSIRSMNLPGTITMVKEPGPSHPNQERSHHRRSGNVRQHSFREPTPAATIRSRESTAVISMLYGDEVDAKSKARASRTSYQSAVPKHTSTTNTLYGDDAKVKAAASKKSLDISRRSLGTTSNPAVGTIVMNSTHTAVSTLYGSPWNSKGKAKGSRLSSNCSIYPGAESVVDNSSTTRRTVATLYGNDIDAKAKAGPPRHRTAAAFAPNLAAGSFAANRLSNTSETESMHSTATDIFGNGELKSQSRRSQGLRTPTNPNAAPKHGTKAANAKKKKNRLSTKCLILLFLLLPLLIGAAATSVLFLSRSASRSAGSSHNPSASPTSATSLPVISTDNPTMPPTPPEELLYQAPSEADCTAISKNDTIAGRENLERVDFGLDLEVGLNASSNITDSLVEELLNAIQEKLLPSLIGCNLPATEVMSSWRFVISDAFVKGSVQPDESCTLDASGTQNCNRVFVELHLFLKGDVRSLDIIHLISNQEETFSNHLDLSNPFSIVKLAGARDLAPTSAPSAMPSDVPSFLPTQIKQSPQSFPSMPPTGVKNGEPTSSLSTPIPTTNSSSIGPTKEPSESPSERPSAEALGLTTLSPSSVMPTATGQSMRPSHTPSMGPSNVPISRMPSELPSTSLTKSPAPSRYPTSKPSDSPSLQPSRATDMPSFQPSIETFYWVVCGSVYWCSDPATVLNAKDTSLATGTDVAVRCCSDVEQPGFLQIYPSCPYADSEIGGVCHDSVTYHEANDLCGSVGARLCTVTELEQGCTAGTGCSHDEKMIWSSIQAPAPTPSPTLFPTTQPSLEEYYWLACGSVYWCNLPNSVQNANYDQIGGVATAVRCCSDTQLQDFLQIYPSCPYADSEIGGSCFNGATHHEAVDFCGSIGARLCTVAELEQGCTAGTGCLHDTRLVWTSDSAPAPTPAPTLLPSGTPSVAPTPIPSISPSAFPSFVPSVQPSVESYWVVCGSLSHCSEPNSIQAASHNKVGGLASGAEIAVRCCSDVPLPNFSLRYGGSPPYDSCPYADSEVSGSCHNSVTYHEAVDLCGSMGARLCTIDEVQQGCTVGTGCLHDQRMVWTSNPAP